MCEGDLARLADIVELARTYNAIVIVDDSHGTGVMGASGRGVAEHCGVLGEVDVVRRRDGLAQRLEEMMSWMGRNGPALRAGI